MPDTLSFDSTDDPLGNGIPLGITYIGEGKIEPYPLRLVHKKVGSVLASVVKLQPNRWDDLFLKRTESSEICSRNQKLENSFAGKSGTKKQEARKGKEESLLGKSVPSCTPSLGGHPFFLA
ncbi:MAG: hypothetical protein A4E58_02664 [Syntrophorhabdus sp. PtaB.Bin006]|nr:MAG: hypothetical protein A4E58_02664 [Syntrophorhabdus sp. PtaB.Bin006]